MKILLYGSTGWIGGQLKELLEKEHEVISAKARLNDYISLINEVSSIIPDTVLNCAGLTGRPNVDWCEDNKTEVLQVNVIGAGVLADTCQKLDIHYVYMGTGCIFNFNDEYPEPIYTNPDDKPDYKSINGYKPGDQPNFDGSFYSFSKIITENITRNLPNTLILRIRMPIADTLYPRSFITKITKYEKVVNIPNSMTVLHDLLPLVPKMIMEKKTGVYNFTNPGFISHNEILDLYKKYIDADFEYSNFTLEEQAKVIVAPRSNNYLDTTRLVTDYPEVKSIDEAIIGVFERMKADLLKDTSPNDIIDLSTSSAAGVETADDVVDTTADTTADTDAADVETAEELSKKEKKIKAKKEKKEKKEKKVKTKKEKKEKKVKK